MRWIASNLLWLVLVAILSISAVQGAPTEKRNLFGKVISAVSKDIKPPSVPKANPVPKTDLKTPKAPEPQPKPAEKPAAPKKTYAEAVKQGQPPKNQQQATVPKAPSKPESKPESKPKQVQPEHKPSTQGSDKPKKTYAEAAKEGLTKSKTETPPKNGAKDGSQTKKPRCPHPRSKGTHNKRAPLDCEEWDDNNVKPLTNTHDITSERNPHMLGYSAKYRYTEGGSTGKPPLTDDKLKSMNQAQSKAQIKHYKETLRNGEKPWEHEPSSVNSMRAKKVDEKPNGEKTHEIYASTNHVLKKGEKLPKDEKNNFLPIKASPAMDAHYDKVGAERPYGRHNGQHTEERNAEHAIHEGGPGTKPFEGTRNVAHETRLYNKEPENPHPNEAEPIKACVKSCKPQIDADKGRDLHANVPLTTHQQKTNADREAERKRKAEDEQQRSKQKGFMQGWLKKEPGAGGAGAA